MAKRSAQKAVKKPKAPAPSVPARKRGRPVKRGMPPLVPNTFGRRLRAAREAAGFTQSGFGDVVGINQRVIVRYEQDQAAPSVHVAARMARAAGVSLDALAGLSLSGQDPELAALLSQIVQLSEEDRTYARRFLAGLVKPNGK
jgi:transcriptional regulator with XRE-family HTH domain